MRHTLLSWSRVLLLLSCLSGWSVSPLAAPLNKCVIDGTVTYQQGLCPAAQRGDRPTVDELNTAEKKRRAAATTTVVPTTQTTQTTTGTAAPPAVAPRTATRRTAKSGGETFSCDGRQHCSQMRSCAEAEYFLAHCPGVKMDGDGNGIPCEAQWCGR